MIKFAFYARVAAADQQDADLSRAEQLARCLAYIDAHGWANVAVYVDDTQGAAE